MAKKKAKRLGKMPPSRKAGQTEQGCAPSFLMRKRNEMDKACEPDPARQPEEYIQPDAEKETGGEA